MLEAIKRLFIYEGIYYPVITTKMCTTSTPKYTYHPVYSKDFIIRLPFKTVYISVGIKCKVLKSNNKPYKQWVIDEIESHPEMVLDLEHYNRYSQRVYTATEETISTWTVRVRGNWVGSIDNAIKLTHFTELQPANGIKGTIAVGYCKLNNNWCGWSHRGKRCFNIGTTIKYGDVIYKPTSFQTLLGAMLDTGYYRKLVILSNISAELTYRDGSKRIIYESDYEYGRGKYIIKTNEDAKEAAMTYAQEIS